mgnify:CR=1 FL=1
MSQRRADQRISMLCLAQYHLAHSVDDTYPTIATMGTITMDRSGSHFDGEAMDKATSQRAAERAQIPLSTLDTH